jgi:hypothetical protein
LYLGRFGIVPKAGSMSFIFLGFYFMKFIIDVKDASSAQLRALKVL